VIGVLAGADVFRIGDLLSVREIAQRDRDARYILRAGAVA
jgi:hypothetical protein